MFFARTKYPAVDKFVPCEWPPFDMASSHVGHGNAHISYKPCIATEMKRSCGTREVEHYVVPELVPAVSCDRSLLIGVPCP
ncbi:MAG: hypothetical protein IPH05_03410 [Flavobacteriales bacterium]|nr:hypothetical protein [Flavobacteriales bacterium]